MALVAMTGIDVGPWADVKGGAARAASNPRFCYEWGFATAQVVVLNVWHEQLQRHGDTLVFRGNLRRVAYEVMSRGGRGKTVLAHRARAFDGFVRNAYHEQIPIRLIVLAGRREDMASLSASRVSSRALDPLAWNANSYDDETGEFEICRGAIAPHIVDQFDLDQERADVPARTVTTVLRERDAAVRQAVLSRSAGICEWCGVSGFRTSAGHLYLETHHVVPLSEGGDDTAANVVALCATHHREAHFGHERVVMRDALLRMARQKAAFSIPRALLTRAPGSRRRHRKRELGHGPAIR